MLPLNVKVMSISVNIIGIILSLLMLFDFGYLVKKINTYDNILFRAINIILVSIFVVDSFTYIVDGLPQYRGITFLILAIYFALNPLMAISWVLYCDYKLYDDKNRIQKLLPLFIFHVVIVFVMSLLCSRFPTIFYLDENNIYYRGPYFVYFVLTNFIYLLYSVYLILLSIKINKKSRVMERHNLLFMTYPLFPLIGMLIQSISYGINIMWLMTTVSLLIIYFNFQNTQLVVDPLTEINNRYKFDTYFENYILQNSFVEKNVFLALLDLNKFKSINDRYGHLEGDFALKKTAYIIRKIVDTDDFIARLGGDEFVIIGERDNEAGVNRTIKNIYLEIENYNLKSDKPYNISLSIGYAFKPINVLKNKEWFLSEADKKMYLDKKEKNKHIQLDIIKHEIETKVESEQIVPIEKVDIMKILEKDLNKIEI